MTRIPNPIESSALARPNHLALIWGEKQAWSYSELRLEVQKRAASLLDLGIREGDIVALLGQPSSDWVAAFHAIGWIGAVAMPLSPELSSNELRRILKGVPPKLLWVGPSHEECGLILSDSIEVASFLISTSNVLPKEALWGLEDVRLIVHTSGSTGTPRATRLTTGQILFNAMGSSIRLGHHLDDCWLNCLPLNHMGGLSILLRCSFLGTTVRMAHPFVPEQVNELIESGIVTQISVVPVMLAAILDLREERRFPESLRVLLVGGAPCPDKLMDRLEKIGAPVSVTWGMTETASQITTRVPGDYSPESGVGTPLPFARVAGGESRLSVLGPIVPGGSMLTSDVGRVDASGAVYVHCRSDRILVSGGENIDPVEIENVLNEFCDVAQAVVVDVPHQKWGQRPVAFMLPARSPHEDFCSLKKRSKEKLVGFKVPDQFFWLDDFPRTSLGKVAFGQLRLFARAILAGQKPQSIEIGAKLLGYSAGLEGFEVDNSVNELDGGAKAFVGTEDRVFKRYRIGSKLGDTQDDSQLLAHAHGGFKVGFGVNQGHAPATAVKDGAEAVFGREEHFFEGGVTILKDSTKKGDSGAINFIESDGNGVFETHRDSSFPKINPKEVV